MKVRFSFAALSAVLVVAAGGCGDYARPVTPTADTHVVNDTAVGTDASVGVDVAGDVAAGQDLVNPGDGSIPCEIRTFLTDNCISCHGATLVGDSPMALLTYDDFLAPSRIDPSKTIAETSRSRIRSASRPMPPTPAVVDETALTAFETWLALGMPSEACDQPEVVDPFAGPAGCTSNSRWTRGDDGSNLMHPGGTCISCHTAEREGPRYRVAGTVFPHGRDVNDCNGVSSALNLRVEIRDANGATYNLKPNSAGNFYMTTGASAGFVFPYTARVIDPTGKERAMTAPQMNGDCNTCHTSAGAEDAPGRVVAP